MFADDTKIWCVVKDVEDNLLLQKDLDSMAEWSEEWLVSGQFRSARFKCEISACKQSNLCCYDGFCTNLCCAKYINILTGPREQNRGLWVG